MRSIRIVLVFFVSLVLLLGACISTATVFSAASVGLGASVDGGDGDSTFFEAVTAAVEQKRMVEEKTSWPELVGVHCEEAKKTLESTTDKNVYLVPVNSLVTMEYRTDRVRIFCSADGTVTKPPRVG